MPGDFPPGAVLGTGTGLRELQCYAHVWDNIVDSTWKKEQSVFCHTSDVFM